MLLSINHRKIRNSVIANPSLALQASVSDRMETWQSVFMLRPENEALLRENARLKEENSRMRKALSMGRGLDSTAIKGAGIEYIPCMVISNTVSSLHNHIIINAGLAQGVRPGMGVITSNSIVGYVDKVAENYSRVASVLNTDNSFSGKLASTGTFGTIVWPGASPRRAQLREIPIHATVNTGDTVVTSGYSSHFPAGIMVGTVLDKQSSDGINYSLDLALFTDFSSLHYVYVVKSDIEEQTSTLLEKNEGTNG